MPASSVHITSASRGRNSRHSRESGGEAVRSAIESGASADALPLAHALTSPLIVSTISDMDLDELFPDKPDDPLKLLAKQDLDPLSVEELANRIVLLEAEIARVKAKLEASVNFRASADELFRK
jgi:uncharacterized small protein (DUF1192 family)